MRALYDEVDCLNDRVVTMLADKLKRQYLRRSSFSILTILERLCSITTAVRYKQSQMFVVRSEDYGCKMVSS